MNRIAIKDGHKIDVQTAGEEVEILIYNAAGTKLVLSSSDAGKLAELLSLASRQAFIAGARGAPAVSAAVAACISSPCATCGHPADRANDDVPCGCSKLAPWPEATAFTWHGKDKGIHARGRK